MSRIIAEKVAQNEDLSEEEQAYLEGWMAASSLRPRSNSYKTGTLHAIEYDRGYTDSLCDVVD